MYLDKQIEIVKPKTITLLGSIATQYIFEKYSLPKRRILQIHRQHFGAHKEISFDTNKDIDITSMFHPAAGLRTPALESIKKYVSLT